LSLRKEYFEKHPQETDLKKFTLKDIIIRYERPELEPVNPLKSSQDWNPFDFTMDEDRLYAMCMFKYTYGYWDLTRNEVRNSPYLLFNWVAQTRNITDIQKRSDFLIS